MSRPRKTIVTASTESPGGHIVRFLTRSAVTIIAACVTLVTMTSPTLGIDAPLGVAWAVAAAVGAGAAIFVIPFCEARFVPRGKWCVRDNSIAFEPFHGRGVHMVLDDVEAMRLSSMRIELSDGERWMWVGSPTIGARAWHGLRQALLKQLDDRLDLPAHAIHEYGWRDRLTSPRGRAILALSGLSITWCIVTWLAVAMQLDWPAGALVALMFTRVVVDALLRRTVVLQRMQKAVQPSATSANMT